MGVDQDKINGSDRECRRQQEIQSRPINNILVRQQLPPPQPPLPHSTSDPHVPAEWAPLITGLQGGEGGPGCTILLSYGALTHFLPPFVGHSSFSMCVRLFRGWGLSGDMEGGVGVCVWWSRGPPCFLHLRPCTHPSPLNTILYSVSSPPP